MASCSASKEGYVAEVSGLDLFSSGGLPEICGYKRKVLSASRGSPYPAVLIVNLAFTRCTTTAFPSTTRPETLQLSESPPSLRLSRCLFLVGRHPSNKCDCDVRAITTLGGAIRGRQDGQGKAVRAGKSGKAPRNKSIRSCLWVNSSTCPFQIPEASSQPSGYHISNS